MVNDIYETPRDEWDRYGEETPGQARARKKARANMTDTPTTKTGRVSPAWGAMLEDIMGLWGYGEPDVDDVMETLAEHRPFIEAEARAELDVARLEWFAWFVRKSKGTVADVTARALEQNPYLRASIAIEAEARAGAGRQAADHG